MTTTLDQYHARMQRVLDHIDRHLDGDLDLEAMSGVAAFSKFHFHRQFKATFGVSLHRYVQLARMRQASKRLADGQGQSVTDIALDAGYETPDAFARAFRQRFAQSPSSFRKSPEWEPWLAAFGPLNAARSKIMPTTFTPDQVTLREVAPTRVAIFEHGAIPRPSTPPSSGSSPGAKPPGFRPAPTRPSTSGIPSGAPPIPPTTAWISAPASALISRSSPATAWSRPAKSPADAARCCG